MVDLNARQRAYLSAAFDIAPHDGIAFGWRAAGAAAEPPFDESESYDLAVQLQRLNLLRIEEDKAYLDVDGREQARIIRGGQRAFSFTAADARFLLAAFAEEDGRDEFQFGLAFQRAGIDAAEREQIVERFEEANLIIFGSAFGYLRLTPQGLEAVRTIRRMRLLSALYEKVEGDTTRSESLVVLGEPLFISERYALEAAAELSRAQLVTLRAHGVCALTEAGRAKAAAIAGK